MDRSKHHTIVNPLKLIWDGVEYKVNKPDQNTQELVSKEYAEELKNRGDELVRNYNAMQDSLGIAINDCLKRNDIITEKDREMQEYREKYTCNQHTVVNQQATISELKSQLSDMAGVMDNATSRLIDAGYSDQSILLKDIFDCLTKYNKSI